MVGHKLPTSLDEALQWAEKGFAVDQKKTMLHHGKSVSGNFGSRVACFSQQL